MVAVAVAACSYEGAPTNMAQRVVQIDHFQDTGKGGIEIEA